MTAEQNFTDQSRWNAAYGSRNLAAIQNAPEKFLVDRDKLPARQASLIEAMADIRGKRVLEFGSGRGEFAVALSKLGARVTGIDIGEDLVELAKRVAAVNGVECEFAVGSIDRLDFRNESFDFVVGNAILHHLPKRGVVDSLSEAHRVLKPSGMALFNEPVENSKVFDFVQNLFPVGASNTPQYRPSVLQRAKWRAYRSAADDRSLSNRELIEAKGRFREVEFVEYHGLSVRLARLLPHPGFRRVLTRVDSVLTHKRSPMKALCQSVLVAYRK